METFRDALIVVKHKLSAYNDYAGVAPSLPCKPIYLIEKLRNAAEMIKVEANIKATSSRVSPAEKER